MDQPQPTLDIKLEPGESVALMVRKYWTAMVLPLVLGLIFLTVIWLLAYNVNSILGLGASQTTSIVGILVATIVSLIVVAGLGVIYSVNNRNFFVLTNLNIIQNTQQTPFDRSQKTVSLAEIRDVEFTKNGILGTLLNYGDLHVSVIGDENAYHRYLAIKSLSPSRENWRAFSEQRMSARYRKPKCC